MRLGELISSQTYNYKRDFNLKREIQYKLLKLLTMNAHSESGKRVYYNLKKSYRNAKRTRTEPQHLCLSIKIC